MRTTELTLPQPSGPSGATTSFAPEDILAPALAGGRVVVAVDGSRASDAALRVGDALARRDGAEAVVVSVYDPLPSVGVSTSLTSEFGSMDAAMHADFRRSVEAQRRRTALEGQPWKPLHERGQPALAIDRVARSRDARLIVLGLGRHGPIERALGKETALQVARLAAVPILAVPATARALPRRVLVATDFSPSSLVAARAALALLGEKGALILMHVGPRLRMSSAEMVAADPSWLRDYDREAEAQLLALEHALGAPTDVHVERVLRHGDAPTLLLEYAQQAEVDLIATGSRGHGALVRVIVGSVSTRVLRGARCAVLMTPPSNAVMRT